jgi:peptide-methionine (R)-S-oxide reductase
MFGFRRVADTQVKYPVMKTEAEWRRILKPAAFEVLRQEGTERPFTSPLNNEHRSGIFHCQGCNWPLFSSKNKFDSGTGWPSFDRPLNAQAVLYTRDASLGMVRTEVHCAHCGGHLGHVFDDGPIMTTGKRFCMNGVAMTFEPRPV